MTADFAALKDQWTAYAQSLRLWVLQVIVWLADVTGCRELRLHARSELRYLRREVRQILLARMAIEICAAPRTRKKQRAHVGEWIVHRRRFHRHVLRGARLRTFEEARRVLAALEAHVARCVANYREGMKTHGAWSGGAPAAVGAFAENGADAPDTS